MTTTPSPDQTSQTADTTAPSSTSSSSSSAGNWTEPSPPVVSPASAGETTPTSPSPTSAPTTSSSPSSSSETLAGDPAPEPDAAPSFSVGQVVAHEWQSPAGPARSVGIVVGLPERVSDNGVTGPQSVEVAFLATQLVYADDLAAYEA